MNDVEGQLESSIADAVQVSRAAARALRTSIDGVLHGLEQSLAEFALGEGAAEGASEQIVSEARRQLESRLGEVRDLFARQEAALSTFNIALFGRTGAGKSSLVEALIRGHGDSVSPGDSDWTTDVKGRPWHSCQVIDTPGIDGWGGRRSRVELEAKAREAAAVADIVLLCFDSQKQSASEFEKVASWVRDFGKPCVAVLNVRNLKWRLPAEVHIGSQRQNLSRSVSEHAQNIRNGLSQIGLDTVPLVAMSTQRALFARATEPYAGQDPPRRTQLLKTVGLEQLADSSNFPAFEALLVRALNTNCAGLRLGMLREQTSEVLKGLSADSKALQSQAQTELAVVDTHIEQLLLIFGRPPDNSATETSKLVIELERVRGGTFDVPTVGEFERYAEQRIKGALSEQRQVSIGKAEECILQAFDLGAHLSSDDLRRASFDDATIQRLAGDALNDAVDFAQQRAKIAAKDIELDLRALEFDTTPVNGRAGRQSKTVGRLAQVGKGLVNVGMFGISIAAYNGWNPGGWVLGGIAAAGLVVGKILSWFGGKKLREAEDQKLSARRNAIAQVREGVKAAFDAVQAQIVARVQQQSAEFLSTLVDRPIRAALTLTALLSHLRRTELALKDVERSLPPRSNPQAILVGAAHDEATARYPGRANGASLLWLGENWLHDDTGLVAEEGDRRAEPTAAYDPGFFTRVVEQLRDVFERWRDTLEPGGGRQWLSAVAVTLDGDPEASEELAPLRAIAAAGIPRIHFVGDYNAGKSSFIKRLLIDDGQPIPPSLNVRADPTTTTTTIYEWKGFHLVDTPGFQSIHEGHTDEALRSFPDASAIVYLFQPNLVVGDHLPLDTVLRGDRDGGFAPKAARTLFIVNRCDELGLDPEHAESAYLDLCARKKRELSQALLARDVAIKEKNILCMASDPFGLVGDREDVSSREYDRFRGWDGFAAFAEAFRGMQGSLRDVGVDRSVLEGGISRLSRVRSTLVGHAGAARERTAALERMIQGFTDADRAAVALDGALRADFEKLLSDHAFGILEETLAASTDNEIASQIKALEKWWESDAFKTEVGNWQTRAARTVDEWFLRVLDELQRRMSSPSFRAAFPDFDAESGVNVARKEGGLGKLAGALGKPLRGINRDIVYGIGKALGFNFAPWGAVNLAKLLGQVGIGFAAVAVVFDLVDIVKSIRDEKRRETTRQKLAKFVATSVDEVRRQLTSTDTDGGVFVQLANSRKLLAGEVQTINAELDSAKVDLARLEHRRARLTEAIDGAWGRLGVTKGKGSA